MSDKLLDQIFVRVCDKLKNHDKQLKENFQRLPTNFDRFKFIWCLGVLHTEVNTLLDKDYYDTKDTQKSNDYRAIGNELYAKKRYSDAITKYNLSIKFAVNPKVKILNVPVIESAGELIQGLGTSYANRSAAFFQLNEFMLCLVDIDLALANGYASSSRQKLIERKLACLYRLGNYERVLEVIAEEHALELEVYKQYIKNIEDIKKKKEAETEKKVDDDVKNYLDAHIDITYAIPDEEKNSKLVCASKDIAIEYGVEKGFFIQATNEIEAGELIVDEPPYASVLLGSSFGEHCFECHEKLAPMKQNICYCRKCVNVAYCCSECEKKSWKSHKYECQYIKLLAFDSGLTHMEWLAMRIVLKATFDHLYSERNFFIGYEKQREIFIRDETSLKLHDEDSRKLYKSDFYFNIFHLITNSVLRTDTDLFRRAFIALFLTKLLLKTGFIKKRDDQNPNDLRDNACYIGGLILRHLQSISCNAHEISMLKLNEEDRKPMATSFANGIGAGIFALMSVFNHSCDPHVTRNFLGNRCQVRTVRKVKNGEQVFDNYGALYAVNDIEERHEKLIGQYFFECKCVACEKNWPLYDQIPKELGKAGILCDGCHKKKQPEKNCDKCSNELDHVRMYQYQSQDSLANFLMIKQALRLTHVDTMKRVDSMFENWYNYLALLEKHKVKRPFIDYNNYQEALKQLLNLIYMK